LLRREHLDGLISDIRWEVIPCQFVITKRCYGVFIIMIVVVIRSWLVEAAKDSIACTNRLRIDSSRSQLGSHHDVP